MCSPRSVMRIADGRQTAIKILRPTKISFCDLQMIRSAKLFWPNCRRPTLNAFRVAGSDVLLHVMYHGHGTNQHDGRNNLVRVKAGMEESPGDAHRSEGLHHFEVACRRCAREAQAFIIDQERNPA